jgi:hypothetical protein
MIEYIVGSVGRFRPNGVSFSVRPTTHTSLEDAFTEVDRLKELHPGVKFRVFELPLNIPFKGIARPETDDN